MTHNTEQQTTAPVGMYPPVARLYESPEFVDAWREAIADAMRADGFANPNPDVAVADNGTFHGFYVTVGGEPFAFVRVEGTRIEATGTVDHGTARTVARYMHPDRPIARSNSNQQPGKIGRSVARRLAKPTQEYRCEMYRLAANKRDAEQQRDETANRICAAAGQPVRTFQDGSPAVDVAGVRFEIGTGDSVRISGYVDAADAVRLAAMLAEVAK